MLRRTVVALLLVASLAWAVSIVAVPLVVARSRAREAPPAVASVLVYVAGSVVCHQRPERSFHVDGVPLPVCARCLGFYVAAPLGLAAAVAGLGLGLTRTSPRTALLLAALPTAATLAVEWAGVAQPGNAARFAAALPLAMIGAWVIGRGLLVERKNGRLC
ncbi:MAG: DUF2085 domain-containing protein [Luteitalea sp.]|nr:DUF2085 domain-containing protein [Luteitalea sp.]